MPAADLKRVARAADAVARAQRTFEQTIRDAYDAGESLRSIAEAAHVSHERVRTITTKETV